VTEDRDMTQEQPQRENEELRARVAELEVHLRRARAAAAPMRGADLIDNCRDHAVFLLDAAGLVSSWNIGAQLITGYLAEDIIGQPTARLYTPDDVSARLPEQELTSTANLGRLKVEGWRLRKDGSQFWADTVITAIRDETGSLRGFASIMRDDSVRKQTDDKLKLSLRALERSNQELEQFAYVASHDLQEPLRMVSSFTQLLAQRYGDKLDQDARDFIGFAVDGANRMQRLIQDLLSFSRVTTRGKPLVRQDPHDALGEALKNLQLTIQETSALVSNDELPEVLADRGQLVQVFQNLIGNAIKFRRPEVPPRVHVGVRPDTEQRGFWMFEITDNGIGIDPAYFNRLFVIFQRLHTKQEYPGTGIGLAICKRIIERHEGRIGVESEPGKGTCFYFSLKAAGAEHGARR
jgi:two-component system, chemotaxis family, sensor kinase Cph1